MRQLFIVSVIFLAGCQTPQSDLTSSQDQASPARRISDDDAIAKQQEIINARLAESECIDRAEKHYERLRKAKSAWDEETINALNNAESKARDGNNAGFNTVLASMIEGIAETYPPETADALDYRVCIRNDAKKTLLSNVRNEYSPERHAAIEQFILERSCQAEFYQAEYAITGEESSKQSMIRHRQNMKDGFKALGLLRSIKQTPDETYYKVAERVMATPFNSSAAGWDEIAAKCNK